MQNMLFILLTSLLRAPECIAWNEDQKVLCSGQDFRVPVYSRSRIVTFIPSSPPGPKRVLLENNIVKDPRYEWLRDQTLLVKDVTHRDQGLYSIKFSHGFTIETVELIVSECVRKFHKNYGEAFRLDMPPDGVVLELSPLSPLSFSNTPPSPHPSPSSPSLPLSLPSSPPSPSLPLSRAASPSLPPSTTLPPSPSPSPSLPLSLSPSPASTTLPPSPSPSPSLALSLSPSPASTALPPSPSPSPSLPLSPSPSLPPSPPPNSAPASSSVPSLPLSLSPSLPPSLPPSSSQPSSPLSSSSPPSPSPSTTPPNTSFPSATERPLVRAARSLALPLVLWAPGLPPQSPWGRGRMEGRSWVLDRVTPMDQGNYTVKDSDGKVVLRASLVVTAHWANRTVFFKESLYIRLHVPLDQAKLHVTPAPTSIAFSASSRSPSVLLREGEILEEGMWRGRLSLDWNITGQYFVVVSLGERDSGTYEVRDTEGNLVSTDIVRVVHKHMRWRAVIKSISVPSGMFASLAGLILFLKRYPSCKSSMRSGLREQRRHANSGTGTGTGAPPRIYVEEYGEPSLTQYTSSPYKVRTSQQWSPAPSHSVAASPAPQRVQTHTASPLLTRSREPSISGPSQSLLIQAPESRKTSFSLAGAKDCLHSSDHCAQFDIGSAGRTGGGRMDYFTTLPLDIDTSTICSVYTSDKLNMR
ncbi:protein SON-like [Engraulis encrasicolus]|uniref:protein SON-like n=1 Tax=Engraulis encrasicolus TaxID=184585 RepID=UPI002FD5AF3E